MAENEMLDVGNPRRFKRWRAALSNGVLTPSELADALEEDARDVLRKKLRGNPIDVILRACDFVPEARRAAVEMLKDRHLARMVDRALAACGSKDSNQVACHMIEHYHDKLADRAVRDALKQYPNEPGCVAAIETAIRARLDACKPQLIQDCEAALRNIPIPRERARARKPTAASIAAISLAQHK